MYKKTLATAGAAALLVLISATAEATNGTRLIGNGARTSARGGVDIGIADDATAINSNPAGIAFIDGQRLDQSFYLAKPTVSFRGPSDSADSEVGLIPAGSLGVVFDFEEPWHLGEALTFRQDTEPMLPSRLDSLYDVQEGVSGLKLGFGIFPVAGSKVDFQFVTPWWDANPNLTPALPRQPMDWEADLTEVAFTLAIAWRINQLISVGVAPSFVHSRFELDQPVAQPASILQGHPFSNGEDPQDVTTYHKFTPLLGVRQIVGFGDVDYASTIGFRVRIGTLIRPTDWLSLGLTYATQTFKQDYLGETGIDFSRQLNTLDGRSFPPIKVKPIVEQNVALLPGQRTYKGVANARLSPLNSPQEVGIGLGVRVDRVALGLDVIWLNWSSTFDNLEARLYESSSPELNELVGDWSTTQHMVVPLDWKDQVVIAFGTAVAITDWFVLRSGYNYAQNPVPNDTILPTAPAIMEQHVTTGFSLYYRRLEFSFSFEYALPNTVLAQNHRGNENLNNHEIEVSAFFVGLGVGVNF
ncbi:OmpP1/FadL family transporter [Planctomycetota bacterium]